MGVSGVSDAIIGSGDLNLIRSKVCKESTPFTTAIDSTTDVSIFILFALSGSSDMLHHSRITQRTVAAACAGPIALAGAALTMKADAAWTLTLFEGAPAALAAALLVPEKGQNRAPPAKHYSK
eukprot:5545255-Amphidinium_carterae.1